MGRTTMLSAPSTAAAISAPVKLLTATPEYKVRDRQQGGCTEKPFEDEFHGRRIPSAAQKNAPLGAH